MQIKCEKNLIKDVNRMFKLPTSEIISYFVGVEQLDIRGQEVYSQTKVCVKKLAFFKMITFF